MEEQEYNAMSAIYGEIKRVADSLERLELLLEEKLKR